MQGGQTNSTAKLIQAACTASVRRQLPSAPLYEGKHLSTCSNEEKLGFRKGSRLTGPMHPPFSAQLLALGAFLKGGRLGLGMPGQCRAPAPDAAKIQGHLSGKGLSALPGDAGRSTLQGTAPNTGLCCWTARVWIFFSQFSASRLGHAAACWLSIWGST